MSRVLEQVDLTRLPRMPVAELRVLWAEHIGRSPPAQRRLLVRELAWRLQERIHGGLDAPTRRLLQSAMRAAMASLTPTATPTATPTPTTTLTPRRRSATAAAPLPGAARLVRVWRGTAHEVLVLDGGRSYRYRDRTYGSLSEIAREITGAHWSGPRFFGLSRRAKGSE